MASQIIDLTSDSDNSPPKRSQLPPLKSLQNNTKSGNRSPKILLEQAIDGMNETSLRLLLKKLCAESASAMAFVRNEVLVTSDKAVPYHADSDSENREETEDEESRSSSEADEEDRLKKESSGKNLKRKAVESDLEEERSVHVPRYAICENCEEQFDVTDNFQGDCVWHTDIKVVDYESDFWADHDEDCHGRCEDFEDDPNYEEGFVWQCCDNPGGHPGCNETKHRASKVPERKKRRY